jgi:hypothetical protein
MQSPRRGRHSKRLLMLPPVAAGAPDDRWRFRAALSSLLPRLLEHS